MGKTYSSLVQLSMVVINTLVNLSVKPKHFKIQDCGGYMQFNSDGAISTYTRVSLSDDICYL